MADRHCDFLYGSDVTGTGDVLAPFQTMAVGVSIARGFTQGDKVILHNDEVLTAAVVLPAMASRITLNSIVGVNKVTGLEDGSRILITQSGGVSWLSAGVTYQWCFRNFLIQGFASAPPLFASVTNSFSGAEWYNCKFSQCAAITNGNNFHTQTTFRKCVFEDLAVTGTLQGNTAVSGQYIDCLFRRCVTTITTIWSLLTIVIKRCMFIDCSSPRYGVSASSVFDDIIIDRWTFTGTGNVDNAVLGANISLQAASFRNILITNIYFANTPTTAIRVVALLSTGSGQIYYVENLATWNIGSGVTSIKKVTNPQIVAIIAENAPIELTESPWENDDGVIANPMAAYVYKANYAWRRKSQALTDISGWSYPV